MTVACRILEKKEEFPSENTYFQKNTFQTLEKQMEKLQKITRKWHSESADPAKALDLSLAKQRNKQTNKQTNKKFCPHRGSNTRLSRF